LSVSQTVRPPAGSREGRRRWDVLVIGCGVMGASVTYNLAKRGLRVLNLERFAVNHKFGSSHGRTRIIRLAYYEDPRYVPLLRRAYEAWKEVESRSGKKLLQITGGLMIGREDGELVSGVLKSAKTHDLHYELLSSSEAEDRFEAFALGDEYCAVYEEESGILFAEACVRAFVGLGSEAGGEFRFSEEVSGWKSGDEGVEVETAAGRQVADRLVICGGAWNEKLLRGLVPLQTERQTPIWFASGGEKRFAPPKMPVFMMEEEKDVFYYGIPDVGHGVKVGRSHGGETGDPDRLSREVTEDDVSPVKEFVSRRIPKLDKSPIASTTCLYSNTPDRNFAVGLYPGEPRVVAVSACSGHGFKFASVLGEVAAELAVEGKSPLDITFLDPGRFKPK